MFFNAKLQGTEPKKEDKGIPFVLAYFKNFDFKS